VVLPLASVDEEVEMDSPSRGRGQQQKPLAPKGQDEVAPSTDHMMRQQQAQHQTLQHPAEQQVAKQVNKIITGIVFINTQAYKQIVVRFSLFS